jgi:hypothetical protein
MPMCKNVTIECPGVADECRLWWECSTCEPSTAAAREAYFDDSEIHGAEHLLIDGRLMTATDRCYIATHESLTDGVDDLPDSPGRYPVRADFGDGTELHLTLDGQEGK